MQEGIWIALIAAVPPTLAALAAIWQTKKLGRPLDDVNRAVNHRQPGQKTLIETVEAIAAEISHMRSDVSDVSDRLERHLAFHQIEKEQDHLGE